MYRKEQKKVMIYNHPNFVSVQTYTEDISYGSVLYNFSMGKMEVPVPVYEGNARQVRP